MKRRLLLLLGIACAALGAACGPTTGGGDDDDAAGDDDDAGPVASWDSSSIDPAPLAVYLGDPAAVTAEDFADYAIVVLGEAPDAALAGALQANGAEVFGWIAAGAPRAPSEIDDLIASYGAMGLDGATLTDLGLDVTGNNEARPILFAGNARDAGLKVMLSATDAADVTGELDGLGTALEAGDRVLLQGFGATMDEARWRAQVDAAAAGAATYGASVAAVTDGGDDAAWSYAFHAAWLDGLEAVGWGSGAGYAALNPATFPGPADGGAAFAGNAVDEGGGAWSRATDTGTIRVDAAARTATFE